MLSTQALATLQQVKDHGAAGGDTLLESLIEVASEAVQDYLLRPLLYAEEVEYPALDGDCRGTAIIEGALYLRRYPIVSVTEVTVGGDAQVLADVTPAGLPIATQASTVWLSPRWLAAGKLVRFAGWPAGSVVVTYAGGYGGPNQAGLPGGVTPLPLVISQATVLTALRLASVAARGGDLDLVAEVTAGGWEQRWGSGSSSRASLLPEAAKMLLRKYRRAWIR